MRKLFLVVAILFNSCVDVMVIDIRSACADDFQNQEIELSSQDIEIVNDLDFFENWDSIQEEEGFIDNALEKQTAMGDEYEQNPG